MASNRSVSKRYEKKPYLYWWDVWDGRKKAISEKGELVLIQRDTNKQTRISAESLLPLLTEGRRTSRGRYRGERGNWGLYVRPGRIGHIEVEGGRKDDAATIAVKWI